MSQGIGQLDISDRQMLENFPSKTSEWTEIGEAKITHTLFGKAEVRIIRKHDKMRRVLFLTALVVIAGELWLGWRWYQQADVVSSTSLNAGALAHQADSDRTLSTPSTVMSKTTTAPQNVIDPSSALQQSDDVKNVRQTPPAKPVPQQPLKVIRPQPAPLATKNNLSKNSRDKTSLALPVAKSSEIQEIVPARAMPVVTSSPPIVDPMNKVDSTPPTAGDNIK